MIEITDEMVYNAALILHLRHPIYRNGNPFPFDELPSKEGRLADARAALEAAFGKPMAGGIPSAPDGIEKYSSDKI